jgi:uncharacterized delta-60 repeat protein
MRLFSFRRSAMRLVSFASMGIARGLHRSSRTHAAHRRHREQFAAWRFGSEALEGRKMLALTNSVPVTQTAFIDTYQFGNYSVSQPLALTSAQGNGISVSHTTIGTNPLKVSLSVDAGFLTLVHPNPNGGIVYRTGDGYQDPTLVFEGTLADVNTALSWVGYTPPAEQYFQWTTASGGNGHWYQFVSGSKTWTQARDEATNAGGHLATVTSAAESTFVNGLVYDPAVSFWLGGYQDRTSVTFREPAGGWRWVTTEPWSFTNWNAGEPNNSGDEDHLAGNLSSSGRWADLQSTNARPGYIVEFETDPRPAPRTQATLTLTTDDLGFAGPRLTDTDTVPINLARQLGFAGSPNYSTNPAAFDTTLGTNGVVTVDPSLGGIDRIIDMRVIPGGKIVAVGALNNRVGLLRFNADGTLDTTFGPNGDGGVQVDLGNGVLPIEMQIDLSGRIVVLAPRSILRFTADGAVDTTFGTAGNAAIVANNNWPGTGLRVTPENTYAVAVGDLFTAGRFQLYGETGVKLQDHWDSSFGDGMEKGAFASGDGSVTVIGGQNSTLVSVVYRPFNTGFQRVGQSSADLTFNFEIRSSLTLADGRILIVGSSNTDFFVARLLRDGRLDTSFGTNGVSRVNVLNAADEGWRATVTADGKILVTGYGSNGVNNDVCIIRMSYDGVLDSSFGSAGLRWLNLGGDDRGYAVAALPDGKILIGGQTGNDIAFVRLLGDAINPNGPSNIGLSAATVLESVAVGTAVGSLTATDSTLGDTFTFTLVPGTGSTDNALFSVSGNQLLVNGLLDYETKNVLSVRVRATDASGLWFEKTFSITVTDTLESPSAPAEQGSSKLADGTMNAAEVGSATTVRVGLGTSGAIAGDTIELLLGGLPFATPKTRALSASDVTNGYATFTFSAADLRADGSKSLTATARNVTAASAPSGPLTFTLDTIPPTAPGAPIEQGTTKLADNRLNAVEAAAGTTIRVGLGTSGAASGDTVELLLGGTAFATPKTVTLSATNVTNGYVDFTVLGADLGADGSKSLTAIVRDAAGNAGPASGSLAFTMDTTSPTPPAAPIEQGSSKLSDGVLNLLESSTDTTFRVSLGSSNATAGDTVELLLNGAPFATPKTFTLTSTEIANGYVEFVVTPAEIGTDGPKSLTGRVIDAPGNPGVAGAPLAFIKDTAAATAPAAPIEQGATKLSDGWLNAAEAATPTTIRVGLGTSGAIAGDRVDLLLNSAAFSTPKSSLLSAADITAGYVDFPVTLTDLGVDGAKSITATVSDFYGPSSPTTALTFTLDTVPRSAPATPAEQGSTKLADSFLNATEAATTTTIRVGLGTSGAASGDTVELLLGGAAFAPPKTRTLASVDITAGYVDFTVSSADLGPDGMKSITARVTDVAGNPSTASPPITFTKDLIAPNAPAAPTSNTLADGWLNANEAASPITIRVGLGASGAASGDTVELLLGGAAFATPNTMTLNSADVTAGYIDLTVLGTDLGADGSKSLTARVTDQAGNRGAAGAPITFTKDTIPLTAPALPAEQGSTKLSDNILNISEGTTSTTFRVSLGTAGAASGDTVELLLGGAAFSPPKTRTLASVDITAGYFDFTVSSADLGADGAKSITARVNDAAGNAGIGSSPLSFVKDTTAPAATGAPFEQGSTKLSDSRLNAVEAGAATTFRVSLGASGAIAGDTVELLLGGAVFATPKTVVLAGTDITNGYAEFTVLGTDLGADGAKSLTARLTDRNSTGPESTALAFTKDIVAPYPPAAPTEQGSAKLADNFLNAIEAATATTIRVSLGTSGAASGDTVELLLGNASFAPPKTVTLTTTNVSNGYVDFAFLGSDLGADGSKALTARITDQAGNIGSASIPITFTKDVAAPNPPAAPTSSTLADGWLNAAEAATATTIRVSLGTSGAVSGDTVELLLGNASFATPKTVTLTTANVANGYVDFAVLGTDLGADGSKSLTARVTDQAGNIGSASTPITFTKDVVAPNSPFAPSEQGSAKLADNFLNAIEAATATTIRVSLGTSGAASGDTVELLLGNASFATPKTVMLTATNVTSGYVDFAVLGTDLGADGSKSLTARVTDQAGNIGSASTPIAFTKDVAAPNAPSTPAEQGSTKLSDGFLDYVELLTPTTFRVGLGTSGAVVGDTIELLIGGVSFTPAKAIVLNAGHIGSGFVDFSVTNADLGGEGSKSLTARVTDVAGNVGAASAAAAFTKDTISPVPGEVGTTKLADGNYNIADAATATTVRVYLANSGAAVGDTLRLRRTTTGAPPTTVDIKTTTLHVAHIFDGYVDFVVTAADLGVDGAKALSSTLNAVTTNIFINFTKDTVAPNAPSIPTEPSTTKLGDGKLNLVEYGSSTAIRISLSGDAVAGDVASLLLNGSPFAPANAITLTSAHITAGFVDFVVQAPALGADGTKAIAGLITDAAGNAGPASVSLVFELDTLLPAAPSSPVEVGTAKFTDGWLNTAEAATTTTVRVSIVGAVVNDTLELLVNGSPFSTAKIVPITAVEISQGFVLFTVSSTDIGSDGLKALSARIIDQSGNVSNAATPPLSFTKDTSAPSAPGTPAETGNTKLSDSFANAAELAAPIVIRVSLGSSGAVVGDTVTLLLGGVAFTPAKNFVLTALDLSNGFIDFSVSASDLAADGAKSITARVTDAAGNQGTVTTTALTFTKDTAGPGAPNVPFESGTGKLSDGKFNSNDALTDTTFRVTFGASGAVAGDKVELLLNGVPFAPASSQNPWTLVAGDITNGYVEFTLTSANLGADGPKALSARVIDRAGNPGSPSGSLPFVKDTASPPTPFAPVEQATAKLADGNLNFADAATATWIRVGLGGTGAITGDTVDLLLNGNAFTPAKSVVLSPANAVDGFVDFLVTTADLGADGSKALAARLTDVNGASVVSASLSFIKDTQAPTAPAQPSEAGSTKLADGKLNLIEAASQTTIRVSLSGTGAVAGDTLTLRLSPTSGSWPRAAVLTATDIANGRVDFLISHADLGVDGFKILSAEISDGFGNVSAPSVGLVFEKDTVAPTGPAAPIEAGLARVIDGYLNIVDAQTPMSVRVALGASVRANDTVELLLGSSPFSTPKTIVLTPLDIAAGSVTYTVSSADLGSDGSKSIAARIIDQSGNVGDNGPALVFVKDTTAPSATAAPAERGSNKFTTDGVLSATDAVTSTVIRVNLGTSGAVVGDTLELLLGGVAFVPAKTRVLDALNISDSFVDFVVSTTDLGADGAKSISARMTDIAGNPGAIGTTPLAFVKDVTAPGAPAAPTEQGSIKLADFRLNDVEASTATTFSVALGTSGAITGDTIELLLGGAPFATAKTTTLADADVSNGFVTFSVSGADLGADGAKSLTARLTDRNSTGPESLPLNFSKDTTAPSAPTLSLAADTGSSNSDGITNNGTVNVGGIEASATWQFVTDGSTNWQNGTGSSFQLPAGTFPAGNVKVRQIDLAGNPGATGAFASQVLIDTASPSLALASNKASLRIGETATITFTLSEPSGNFTDSDVTVTGGTLSPLAGSGNSYSATFTPFANSTSPGTIFVAIGTFTDAAGNGNTAGALSPPIAIDTVAPGIVSITSGKATLKSGETATVTFTLSEASTTFTATDVTVTGGTLSPLTGSGATYTATFTPTPNSTAPGTFAVAAGTFTDAAGNANISSALTTPISIDTVAPTIVAVMATPAGTVRAGDFVTITATVSEPVQAGSSVIVTLDTGNVVTLVAAGAGTTLTGSFNIQPGQSSNGLRAIAIGLTANGTRDLAGNPLVSTNVPEQVANTNTVAVDGVVKLVTPGGFSGNAAIIADRRVAVTAIPITFSSPVSGFNLSSVRLLLNGRSVSLRGARVTGSGANYVLTIPTRATNAKGIYTLQVLAGQIAATANGALMTEDQAIYWGKGRSVGIAPVAKAAAFAAGAKSAPKPAPAPRAAAFRRIR